MQLECFRGADFSQVSARARHSLGEDVMILHTRTVRDDGVPRVEVLAAPASTLEHVQARLTAAPLPTPLRRPNGRPYVIALVGPTGAGKTTTAAKLAVRPGTFGIGRTGLLTIDTYRVGGMEQLATYAELASVPFDVVYDAAEVNDAFARLRDCDVIVVDTPGRSPAAADVTDRWRSLLDAIKPDEVHLVLPATMRGDLALGAERAYRTSAAHVGATHLLLSKLDEVPASRGVTDLAMSMARPARWITDGQDVPANLAPAVPRLLRSLGLGVDADDSWTNT
jgi:flagellar biosynthesis protein FlhF